MRSVLKYNALAHRHIHECEQQVELVDALAAGEQASLCQAEEELVEDSLVLWHRITALSQFEQPLFDLRDANREWALGKRVLLQFTVDETLLGGLTIQVGDRKFDGSVKAQLRELRHTLSAQR